jgi:hypothetical protein
VLINEMQTKTESLPRYFAYVFLVFWFYLIQNVLTSIQTTTQNNTTYSLLTLGISLLVMPFIFAGVIGGIHQQQRNQEISNISAFFKGGKAHYWRILAASLLSYGLILLSGVIISMIIFSTSGGEELADSRLETIMAILDVPYSAMTLFWFTAIVVERKFFAGLWHAIKTLFTSPAAMVIAIGWAAVRYTGCRPGRVAGSL